MRVSNFLAISFITIFTASGLQAACAQDNSVGKSNSSGATPSQIYLNFHEKLFGASSVEELCPMLAADRVEKIKSDEKTLPAEQTKAMFQFMQQVSPRKVRILGEAVTNDTCTLTLDAPDYKDPIFGESSSPVATRKGTIGKVSMVREDGQWKIEKESWMSGH
ncbi:hypothetical protein KBI23_16705 [bacterium]|nr:hypothetical protein [bacterium]MBP9810121.1 hypothetical protein [bacterium]